MLEFNVDPVDPDAGTRGRGAGVGIADTSQLQRYYLDTNAWDRLLDHPDADGLLRCLTRPNRRAIFPSFINAIEILRIQDKKERKRRLCALVSRAVRPDHVVLGMPADVVVRAVQDFRTGESTVVLGDTEDTDRLRALLANPDDMKIDELNRMEAWIDKVEAAVQDYWSDVPESALNRDLKVTEEILSHVKMTELLLSLDLSIELKLSAEDLPRLRQGVSVWAAMVCSMGVLVAQSMRNRFSRAKARELPCARDILQLTYLGLVNRFVTDDEQLLVVAREEVVPFLPSPPEVLRPGDLFKILGYP